MKKKVNKLLLLISIIFSLAFVGISQTMNRNTQIKNTVYVPDSLSAIKIAEIIWLPIFGRNVLKEKPYRAILINDSIWVVEGTLKKGSKGGVAYIEIQKSDCKILTVTHGK